jgi:hypothetical protein
MSRSAGMTKSLRRMTAFLSDPTNHWRGQIDGLNSRANTSIGLASRS